MSEPNEWADLVAWLQGYEGFVCLLEPRDVPGAGRGLFTTRALKEGETLLEIPAGALLNPLTLRPTPTLPSSLFPQPHRSTHYTKKPRESTAARLNTTQLLTLYLALTRQEGYADEWVPYVRTLPKSFRPWHPLTWAISPPAGALNDGNTSSGDEWEWWNALLENMPLAARRKVEKVKERYEDDFEVLRTVLRAEPYIADGISDKVTAEDLLWAWLNVNTRTVSIPLGLPEYPPEVYNHTVVPLLDMINHSSQSPSINPTHVSTAGASVLRRPGQREGWHTVPGKVAFRLIAPPGGMKAGEQITFEYGNHSSTTLMSEYGFVEAPIPPNPNGLPRRTSEEVAEGSDTGTRRKGQAGPFKKRKVATSETNGGGSLDALRASTRGWLDAPYAEVDFGPYIDERWEKVSERTAKEEVLKAIGCWGKNTIHARPAPIAPSHTLLMTLRVYHLAASQARKLDVIKQGAVTYVSPENEKMVRSTLQQLCKEVAAESETASRRLSDLYDAMDGSSKGPDRQRAMSTVKMLWEEQLELCRALLLRIEAGDDLE